MAQQEQTTASPSPPPSSGAENSMGLKAFNRTGQEDTTTQVLRPVGAPGARGRNAALIAIVLVAVAVMLGFAYQRSGLSFIPAPDTGPGFGSEHNQGSPDRAE